MDKPKPLSALDADRIIAENEAAIDAIRQLAKGERPAVIAGYIERIKDFAAGLLLEAGESRIQLAGIIAGYNAAMSEAILHCATEVAKVEMMADASKFGESDDHISAYMDARALLHAQRMLMSQLHSSFSDMERLMAAVRQPPNATREPGVDKQG